MGMVLHVMKSFLKEIGGIRKKDNLRRIGILWVEISLHAVDLEIDS